MPLNGRLLVARWGQQPDAHLIRYASMLTRVGQPEIALANVCSAMEPFIDAGSNWALGEPTDFSSEVSSSNVAGDAEVRFVSLLPSSKGSDSQATRNARARLRLWVNRYFGSAEHLTVSCDVLRGPSARKLSLLAADFDSDLLLFGDGWPKWKAVQLMLESPCSTWFVPSGWAPVLRRILVPIDFCGDAVESLRTAIKLARRFPPAKCIALYVDSMDSRCSGDQVSAQRRKELLDLFERLTRGMNTAGVLVEPDVVKGHRIGRAIQQAADHHSADLIVMSTRGRSRISGRLHPSATDRTLFESRTAFLTLKSSNRPLGMLSAVRERWNRSESPLFS